MTNTTTDDGKVRAFDPDVLRQRYAAERDKRLRTDTLDQYVRLSDVGLHSGDDPYTPMAAREAITDHVTFTFIGAGFSGLIAGARLREQGVDTIRLVDKAGDVGGCWYWNRYPGIMCDTATVAYLPLLYETNYIPKEKYAHGPEIREHCQRIARTFDLYKDALFHTQVTGLEWDEAHHRWIVSTDRGDRFTSTYIGMGPGPLNHPKIPRIDGLADFQGHIFHTSRWDYDYTGGDSETTPYRSGTGAGVDFPAAPMAKLRDKRVAIIGTGATSLQATPALARDAGELFVFQRTPSTVGPRNNGPFEEAWKGDPADPQWQAKLLEVFAEVSSAPFGKPSPDELVDPVNDGFTAPAKWMRAAIRSIPDEELSPQTIGAALEAADFEKMEEIRARVDAVITDPVVAEQLKPWYRLFCKRPGFHDEYLPAFNQPNVHLIDTAGKGVERIGEHGPVVAGVEYPVDCIIFASGFEYGTPLVKRLGAEIVGSDGVTLAEHWEQGMRTLKGMFIHNFPNMFLVQFSQASFFGPSATIAWDDAARTIASVVAQAAGKGSTRVEATAKAEEDWVEMILQFGVPMVFDTSCTPGYYNLEGKIPNRHDILEWGGYPHGPDAYFKLMAAWRKAADFSELAMD